MLAVVTALSWHTPVRADIVNQTGVPVSSVEQQQVNAAVATFTDTNLSDTAATFAATINWGDATISAATVTSLAGAFTVSGTHTYADEGSFTTSVHVTDSASGAQFDIFGSATSAEADIITPAGLTFGATAGQTFFGTVAANFTDTNLLRVASDFNSTINWGDATISAGTVTDFLGSIAVSGSHTYAQAGDFVVTAALGLDPSTGDPDSDSATAVSKAVVTSPVPEPSTATLLGLGLSGLLLLTRRSMRGKAGAAVGGQPRS